MNRGERTWRERLSPVQFHVTREKGTEPPWTGKYCGTTTPGTYRCVCCGQDLFSSAHKYQSGTGWPSFWEPIAPESVRTEPDFGQGIARFEVLCSRCSAHLGHVFPDGPWPTGLRYCINSAALDFREG